MLLMMLRLLFLKPAGIMSELLIYINRSIDLWSPMMDLSFSGINT